MYQQQLDSYFRQHQDELISSIARLCQIPSFREDPLPGKPYGEGPAAALAAYSGLKPENPLLGRILDVYRALAVAKK